MEKKKILTFWRDVEIFTLPDLPEKAKEAGDKLPWELPFTPDENFTYRHVVYFGKQSKQDIISLIEKQINHSPDADSDWQEKTNGFTCMALMVLNESGTLANENAYIQASYLHGLLCLQEKGNLADINNRLQMVQEKFRERHPYNTEAENLEALQLPVVTWATLRKETKVLNDLQIPGIECTEQVFVNTFKISKKSKGDTAFLNSFFLDDLNQLLVNQKEWNKGLKDYLEPTVPTEYRVNVMEDASAFFDLLNPHTMSPGKWPSNPDYGLYAAQLAAVNLCLQNLRGGGLTGVNGPPGTGKTTLLSDIVAHVITHRGLELMKHPESSLFSGHGVLKREPYDAYYYHPVGAIFEETGIVVASNNNAAVENISKVLPDKEKIDFSSFPEAGYFSDFSQGLISGEGWGILAAALGNAENKSSFKSNFWYKNELNEGFNNYLMALYKKDEELDERNNDIQEKITDTKKELKKLLKEFSEFQKNAKRFFELLPLQLADLAGLPVKKEELQEMISTETRLKQELLAIGNKLQQIQSGLQKTSEQLSFHLSLKPSFFFFQKLFRTRPFRVWNKTYAILLQEYNTAIAEQSTITQLMNDCHNQVQEISRKKNKKEAEITAMKERIIQYKEKKDSLHRLYGIRYQDLPDEHMFFSFYNNKEQFHTSNPWSSQTVNSLRTRIFLKSLKLHEHYIMANAKQFRNNLSLLMDLLDGKVNADPALCNLLWQSFFFCIPVVSTSLASVSRLFNNLRKNSIGWLLVDEAGQATPQSVAGIINRSKRSIIIGDPLQIEPVVTIPSTLITMLRTQHGIASEWSPSGSSAQSLADRITSTGTFMSTGLTEPVWSGFPLRTHRRCNNPMFSIANEIAYSGQMVKAVPDADFNCPLGDSQWFDIAGTTVENGQVVKEEIVLLQQKLRELGPGFKNVFVISPFKSVANACREVVYGINRSVQCGTIHTFQGKEADIVILVLGSDPQRPGTRNWASSKPNILNVALTRAKKRFYVIGNRKQWKGMPFFSVLDRKI